MTAKSKRPEKAVTNGRMKSETPRSANTIDSHLRGSTRSVIQPEKTVPTKFNPPITPTRVAAVTCGIPWSISCGIKCVPISPLAVPPQIKKLPASSQKVDDLKTSESGIELAPFETPRKEASDAPEAATGSPEP